MTEKELRLIMFDMLQKLDKKTDGHGELLAAIQERLTHLMTKEDCLKARNEEGGNNVKILTGKGKVLIPAGIITAIGAAIAAILSSL
jgi:hypothetical protein